MTSLTGRRARLISVSVLALVVVCAAIGVGSTSARATKGKDSVHITVAPSTGKYGSKYNVNVKGKATVTGEELELAMTINPGTCPADYTSGFASLSGLSSTKGKPLAPKYVHGTLKMTVHAKMTISSPGTYGMCAYLLLGSVTKAHASSHYTITQ